MPIWYGTQSGITLFLRDAVRFKSHMPMEWKLRGELSPFQPLFEWQELDRPQHSVSEMQPGAPADNADST